MHILKKKLTNQEFVVTMEVDPPRGANPWPVYESLNQALPYLTAVNIADSPTAKLRMSPIVLASLVQNQSHIETIFHLTCRDRNVLGLQSELLGAYALGVTNILTLTGDDPKIGDHPAATGVFDVSSAGLAKIAADLNLAKDYMGNALADATDFYIGAVANPAMPDLAGEAARIADKIAHGVHFFQTQPVYSIKQVEDFLAVAPTGVPYIFGIMPIRSVKQAHYMNEKVPGVEVPQAMIDLVASEGKAGGLRWLQNLIQEMRSATAGIHIFPMGDYSLAEKLVGDA